MSNLNPLARFMQLDPGHFHSALVLRDPLPEVDPGIHVFSSLNPLLAAHINLVSEFNARKQNPCDWSMEIKAGPSSLERMLENPPGNVVVLAGYNKTKIHKILACLEKGIHVFADKPWVIDPVDFPNLLRAHELAKAKNLVALDIMTERHEVVSLYQRALVSSEEIFGKAQRGQLPAMELKSNHAILKKVNGQPLKRPASFFNIFENGEGLADVGIHLADLALFVLFPNEPVNWKNDIQVHAASRWPTVISKEEFLGVTGLLEYPCQLGEWLKGDQLHFLGNNSVEFSIRGVKVCLETLWEFPKNGFGTDSYASVARGDKGEVEILQNSLTGNRAEVFYKPHISLGSNPLDRLRDILRGLGLQGDFQPVGEKYQLHIPDELRSGHESHFAKVTKQFLNYLSEREIIPSWELPVQAARYFITMEGIRLGRR